MTPLLWWLYIETANMVLGIVAVVVVVGIFLNPIVLLFKIPEAVRNERRLAPSRSLNADERTRAFAESARSQGFWVRFGGDGGPYVDVPRDRAEDFRRHAPVRLEWRPPEGRGSTELVNPVLRGPFKGPEAWATPAELEANALETELAKRHQELRALRRSGPAIKLLPHPDEPRLYGRIYSIEQRLKELHRIQRDASDGTSNTASTQPDAQQPA